MIGKVLGRHRIGERNGEKQGARISLTKASSVV